MNDFGYYKAILENLELVNQTQSENIQKAGARISHTHVANPEGRLWPAPGDGADYGRMIRALEKNGCPGRVSVEGNMPKDIPFEQAAGNALAALRGAQANKEQ